MTPVEFIEVFGKIVNITLGIGTLTLLSTIIYISSKKKWEKNRKTEELERLEMTTELLFYVSAAVHNIGDPFFEKNKEIDHRHS